MEEKKYCEFVIEGVFECSDEDQKELQKKINEAISKLLEDERLVKVDISMSKYSDMDVAVSIINKSDIDLN